MIIQDDTLKLVGDQLTQEPYGAGIKKGDTEIAEFVNGVFQELKDSGKWAELHQEWIGKYTGETAEPPDDHRGRGRRDGQAATRRCSTSSPSTGSEFRSGFWVTCASS